MMTPQEMRDYIMQAPDPLTGPPIYRAYPDDMDAGYSESMRALAKALLLVCEENPKLLEVEGDVHWQEAKKRWPGLDEWLGGITGFQFGWANNSVRYILAAEMVGNPALMTISVKEEDGL